jgi:hypothetical protein
MKSRRIFVLSIALLLSMIAVSGLWAQTTGPDHGNNASPTNFGTSGRYKSSIDDFIQPQDYLNLKLNNWFGYAAFGNPGSTNLLTPRLGFAKQISNIYLGLYYSGTFWNGLNDFTSTEKTETTFFGSDKSVNQYTIPASLTRPDNSVAVILGVANMGFRIGFSSTFDTFNKSETLTDGTDFYKSYVLETGNLVPQLKWGMAKDLLPQGIKPYATVTLGFERNNNKYEQYESASKTEGEYVVNSANIIHPVFDVGLGGFTFYNKDGLKGAADLDYTLDISSYDDNEYSYLDGSGNFKTKKITGTARGKYELEDDPDDPINNPQISVYRPEIIERSKIINKIIPSASVSWSSGNLGVKAKLRANFDITNETSTAMAPKADGSLQKSGNDTTIDTFAFTPRLDLGLQYKLVPNKLTLNVGGRIAHQITSTTTDTKVYAAGTEDKKKATKTIKTDYRASSNANTDRVDTYRLYTGAALNFTDNVALEAVTGIQSGVDVFATGGSNGLFSFGSLAFSLKF